MKSLLLTAAVMSLSLPAAAYSVGDVVDLSANLQGTVLSADGENYKVAVRQNPNAKPTGAVEIKNTYFIGNDNFTVTQIDENAFKANDQITSVSIGPDVELISPQAFYGCTKLKTFSTPADSKVTSVASEAFYMTKALESISLPNVEHLGNWAFTASGLKTATMPKVKTISAAAFRECKSLITFDGGMQCESIGNMAFSMCDNFATFTFGPKLREIGTSAFSYSLALNDVVIPASLTSAGNEAFAYSDIKRIFILSPDFMDYCDQSYALAHQGLEEIYCLQPLVSEIKYYQSVGGDNCQASQLATVQPRSMEEAVFELVNKGGNDSFVPKYKMAGISDLKVYDAADNSEIAPVDGVYTISGDETVVSYTLDEGKIFLEYSTPLTHDSTAVETMSATGAADRVEYYSIDGLRVDNPRHGLFIVRHSDGSCSKVIL